MEPSYLPTTGSMTPALRAARLLGWFSLGLGAAELIAPGRIARALGMEGRETLLRAYGAREVLAGVGALSMEPTPHIWGRVAGDAVDLATLYLVPRDADNEQQGNVRTATAVVAGIAVVDLLVAAALTQERGRTKADGSADYSDRSGFPKAPALMRGAAAGAPPPDFRNDPSRNIEHADEVRTASDVQ